MKSAPRREWSETMTLEDAHWSLVWEFGFSLWDMVKVLV